MNECPSLASDFVLFPMITLASLEPFSRSLLPLATLSTLVYPDLVLADLVAVASLVSRIPLVSLVLPAFLAFSILATALALRLSGICNLANNEIVNVKIYQT